MRSVDDIKQMVIVITWMILLTGMAYASDDSPHLAPDGTYVGDGSPQLAPDGTYVGGKPSLSPDGTYVGDGSDR